MACRSYTSSSCLEQICSISRAQTTDNDVCSRREEGLGPPDGKSNSANVSDISHPRLPKVFNFTPTGQRGVASERWDGHRIHSPIQPAWSTSSSDFGTKRDGGCTTGKWRRSRSAEELSPTKRHDVRSSRSSSLDDLSLTLPDQIWSARRLGARISMIRKPSTDKFQTPAAKRFTRIPTQEVTAEVTPASIPRRSHSLDWDKTEDSGYGSPACPEMLFPELPYKMGRAQLDIITAINEREPMIVDKILTYISVVDAIRFSGVCKEWRRIVEGNRRMALMKRRFINHKQKFSKKENCGKQHHERNTVSASTPLREVQRVGLPLAASTPGPSTNTNDNYDRFIKASDSLFADESLTKCVRGDCRSPARLLMNRQRATCSKCGYDFCTSCLCEFHGGSPCASLRRKNAAKKSHGVGSSKSKRSLQRIARLESYP